MFSPRVPVRGEFLNSVSRCEENPGPGLYSDGAADGNQENNGFAQGIQGSVSQINGAHQVNGPGFRGAPGFKIISGATGHGTSGGKGEEEQAVAAARQQSSRTNGITIHGNRFY